VGGNPEKDALYLPITPVRDDAKTVYKLTVGDVPVDGFWSLTAKTVRSVAAQKTHNELEFARP